jgi:hypothetical protein
LDNIAFALSILANIGLSVILIFGRSYLSSYINEKAKNTATKEDIEAITTKIEAVKSNYQIEIERAKHEYEQKGAFIERKRVIYEKISLSLRIFIGGQELSADLMKEKKEEFFNSYANAWLWSSDEVLNALHKFLDLEGAFVENPNSVNMADRKAAFTAIMIAMRKDCGFPETGVFSYQFRKFIN